MRINKSYQSIFPNNCAVIEVTGDGEEVGTCSYYMYNGKCPRHGELSNKLLINPNDLFAQEKELERIKK